MTQTAASTIAISTDPSPKTLKNALGSDNDWQSIGREIANELRLTVVERERSGAPPVAEFKLLRDAGLLTLIQPLELDGGGCEWTDALRIVRTVSGANTSVGQLLGYHYVASLTPGFFDLDRSDEQLRRRSISERWHWAGSGNPRDPNLTLEPSGTGYTLNGRKSFSSGASIADQLSIFPELNGKGVVAAIPRRREGIVAIDDWNHMGQRQSESGTIEFHNVRVELDEVLAFMPPPDEQPAWMTTRIPMMQLTFVNVYLGAAVGALDAAREYVQTATRPWQSSNVEKATDDPYILEHFGLLHSDLAASLALADQAGEELSTALRRGYSLTKEERTRAASVVYAAKVNSTRVALEVTAKVFDLMGARATSNIHGFDRFWRDVRTHSLHDPVAYKAREVGNYLLNGVITPVRGYT
ncbi:alkylation response protein AidB-like acyl-CoA dehydrogenase [Pararhizobium capsulatum DSM 1112]|uniref:Alkylation response protein AidB-like acyl-CoA dehydrogenase n=1 Tax=Pararhizobium capsulatum DSM 1112 TaxID=1121113 RepID=A0ABU0C0E9_9HYPH|nr:acyl-CoA dehydrogenase family protein [Pararhizobium capsulatum]MDQ0323376.1 alkylation response protein AidB-like acyl-CoA dehydrogenase [Pararhizobium capsulatum DSM 1112]